jgi:hypothetical protein
MRRRANWGGLLVLAGGGVDMLRAAGADEDIAGHMLAWPRTTRPDRRP